MFANVFRLTWASQHQRTTVRSCRPWIDCLRPRFHKTPLKKSPSSSCRFKPTTRSKAAVSMRTNFLLSLFSLTTDCLHHVYHRPLCFYSATCGNNESLQIGGAEFISWLCEVFSLFVTFSRGSSWFYSWSFWVSVELFLMFSKIFFVF